MDWIKDPNALIGLVTLTLLEVVLNIDNIIFITILAGKLPREQQPRARRLGLSLALVTRVVFLLSIAWVLRLSAPLFGIFGHDVTGRDLILIVGGLFLIGKATHEIHSNLEGSEDDHTTAAAKSTLAGAVMQITLIDIVFSIDSVVTAVGMVKSVVVMIVANVLALLVMMAAAGRIGDFVERHPTIKMLALAFLVMIGGNLLIEGFGYSVPKGYTYVAMAFSVFVEMLNIKFRARRAEAKARAPGAP